MRLIDRQIDQVIGRANESERKRERERKEKEIEREQKRVQDDGYDIFYAIAPCTVYQARCVHVAHTGIFISCNSLVF